MAAPRAAGPSSNDTVVLSIQPSLCLSPRPSCNVHQMARRHRGQAFRRDEVKPMAWKAESLSSCRTAHCVVLHRCQTGRQIGKHTGKVWMLYSQILDTATLRLMFCLLSNLITVL